MRFREIREIREIRDEKKKEEEENYEKIKPEMDAFFKQLLAEVAGREN